MIGRSCERGSGISVQVARHDDDDDEYYRIILWLQHAAYTCVFKRATRLCCVDVKQHLEGIWDLLSREAVMQACKREKQFLLKPIQLTLLSTKKLS